MNHKYKREIFQTHLKKISNVKYIQRENIFRIFERFLNDHEQFLI